MKQERDTHCLWIEHQTKQPTQILLQIDHNPHTNTLTVNILAAANSKDNSEIDPKTIPQQTIQEAINNHYWAIQNDPTAPHQLRIETIIYSKLQHHIQYN